MFGSNYFDGFINMLEQESKKSKLKEYGIDPNTYKCDYFKDRIDKVEFDDLDSSLLIIRSNDKMYYFNKDLQFCASGSDVRYIGDGFYLVQHEGERKAFEANYDLYKEGGKIPFMQIMNFSIDEEIKFAWNGMMHKTNKDDRFLCLEASNKKEYIIDKKTREIVFERKNSNYLSKHSSLYGCILKNDDYDGKFINILTKEIYLCSTSSLSGGMLNSKDHLFLSHSKHNGVVIQISKLDGSYIVHGGELKHEDVCKPWIEKKEYERGVTISKKKDYESRMKENLHPSKNSLCKCGSGKKTKRCCKI